MSHAILLNIIGSKSMQTFITISWTCKCFSFIAITIQILYGKSHINSMRLLWKRQNWICFWRRRIRDEIKFSSYEAYFVEWLFDYWALDIQTLKCELDKGTPMWGDFDCFDHFGTLYFMNSKRGVLFLHLFLVLKKKNIRVYSILMFLSLFYLISL